jgi:hypothetical protein
MPDKSPAAPRTASKTRAYSKSEEIAAKVFTFAALPLPGILPTQMWLGKTLPISYAVALREPPQRSKQAAEAA